MKYKLALIEYKLLVLDFVLWNFSLSEDTIPPIKGHKDGIVVDQELNPIRIFPNVYNILTELRHNKYILFLFANRHFVRDTKSLLRQLKIQNLFHEQYFMDGSRIQHIYRASHKYNLVFEDIVYFDSEEVGIQCGRGMSVFTFCVECGINYTLLNQALRYYQDHRRSMFRPKTYFTGRSNKGRFVALESFMRETKYRSGKEFQLERSSPSSSETDKHGIMEKDIFDINDKIYIDDVH